MADQSRRDRVGLGLIGLGSCWEQLYRDTLFRLQNRLTIKLVYDPVEARAKSVAAEFNAEIAESLQRILARPTLQGLLVLDPGWLSSGALKLIARCGKPVYLASSVLKQTDVLRSIMQETRLPERSGLPPNIDDLWIPEFKLRFMPSTCRLRELIATKLGPVENIRIECNLSIHLAELAHLIDWCANLFGNRPLHATLTGRPTSVEPQIHLAFPSSNKSPHPKSAILLQTIESQQDSVRYSMTCQRGTAVLTDRTRIQWQTSTESADESLIDERPETEILIDQFCRRAVGGINPVGRLSEFLQAVELIESLQPDA
jgi:predicted dehydrogenase